MAALRRSHCRYSSLAQLVEHAAVNRRVVGSSPTGGAKRDCQSAVFFFASKTKTPPFYPFSFLGLRSLASSVGRAKASKSVPQRCIQGQARQHMGKPGGEADAGRISHRRSASVLSLRRLFCGGKTSGLREAWNLRLMGTSRPFLKK